jgi:transcriptional regulator with XRE-family HTH domain
MTLKKQLQFYLEKRDIAAAHLARRANVPKQSLSGWLAGSKPRDINQVKRVADYLGVSLDHLMFGIGDEAASAKGSDIHSLLNNEWVSGTFELKIRRVKS